MAGTIALPNSSAPVQLDTGLVNTVWYRYFQELAKGQGGTGGSVSEVVAGSGLSGGTITASGTLSLNLDYFGNAPGDLLYRGGISWQSLAPGAAGQVLTMASDNQTPSWAAPSISAPANAPVLGSNGTGTLIAVALDGTLQENSLVLGVALAPATTLQANVGTSSAQPAGVTLTAFLDAVFGTATGELIYRAPSGWQSLAIGSNGQVLTVSPAGLPQWQNGGVITYNTLTSSGNTLTSQGNILLNG